MGQFFTTGKDGVTGKDVVFPRMGAVLLRESWEDYEYIYKGVSQPSSHKLSLANGNAHPSACKTAATDKTTLSLGRCVTSWRNDPALVKAVRYEMGRYLSGLRPDMPYWKVCLLPTPFHEY